MIHDSLTINKLALIANGLLMYGAFMVSPAIRADVVADRQVEYLTAYYDDVRNDSDIGTDARKAINLAYTTFALNKPTTDINVANAALDQFLTGKENYWGDTINQDIATIPGYWYIPTLGSLITDPNLNQHLTPSNEAKIKTFLVNFSDHRDGFDRPSVNAGDRTRIFSSDNKDIHTAVNNWTTAQIIKNDPAYANYTFPGGDTAEQRYGKWTTKFLDYFQYRAAKGQSVEVGSSIYQPHYFNPIMHLAEYSEDARLRELAREYISLHFADLAQETTNGIRGGAKSRAPKNRVLNFNGERSAQYIYPFVGLPSEGLNVLPSGNQLPRLFGGMTTTDYRVPQEIIDLMSDDTARGTYTYISNRMGEGVRFTDPNLTVNNKYSVPSETQSNLLRTTRVTPEYTLGWFTVDENKDYMPISGQAQAMGVITNGTRDSRLIVNLTGGKVNDELQAVGHGDAMLVRKQVGKHAGEKPRVYVSNNFFLSFEADGWIFGNDNSGAFFALKGVLPTGSASYTVVDASSDGGNGVYYEFDDEDTVVLLQMGLQSEYTLVNNFKDTVRANSLTYDSVDGSVTYDAGTPITIFDDQRVPKVGGQTLDLTPTKVYDSPYLNADYGSNIITFTDLNGQSFDLDFNYNPVAPKQQRSISPNTTQTNVFSPGYREMVGITEYSSNLTDEPLVYTIDPTSILQIDFDGFHNVMDKLIINGSLNLGGELFVSMIRDTPERAGIYQILDANTITGNFDTITLPTAGTGLFWNTDRLYSHGTLALLQAQNITYGDTNTTYDTNSSDDNPLIDPGFQADIEALPSNWDFYGLDQDNRNDVRAMTFYLDSVDPKDLFEVWIEARIAGLGGYENDVMVLDAVGNVRRIDAMEGYTEGGGWMTLRYTLDPTEFALLGDGKLNLAFYDDVRVDWVSLSWLEAPTIPTPSTMLLSSVIGCTFFRRHKNVQTKLTT